MSRHVRLIPFRTAVPFWGQTTWNLAGLSPKRDCGSKSYAINSRTRVIKYVLPGRTCNGNHLFCFMLSYHTSCCVPGTKVPWVKIKIKCRVWLNQSVLSRSVSADLIQPILIQRPTDVHYRRALSTINMKPFRTAVPSYGREFERFVPKTGLESQEGVNNCILLSLFFSLIPVTEDHS